MRRNTHLPNGPGLQPAVVRSIYGPANWTPPSSLLRGSVPSSRVFNGQPHSSGTLWQPNGSLRTGIESSLPARGRLFNLSRKNSTSPRTRSPANFMNSTSASAALVRDRAALARSQTQIETERGRLQTDRESFQFERAEFAVQLESLAAGRDQLQAERAALDEERQKVAKTREQSREAATTERAALEGQRDGNRTGAGQARPRARAGCD